MAIRLANIRSMYVWRLIKLIASIFVFVTIKMLITLLNKLALVMQKRFNRLKNAWLLGICNANSS